MLGLPRGLHRRRFGPGASAVNPKHRSSSKPFLGGCADFLTARVSSGLRHPIGGWTSVLDVL